MILQMILVLTCPILFPIGPISCPLSSSRGCIVIDVLCSSVGARTWAVKIIIELSFLQLC